MDLFLFIGGGGGAFQLSELSVLLSRDNFVANIALGFPLANQFI